MGRTNRTQVPKLLAQVLASIPDEGLQILEALLKAMGEGAWKVFKTKVSESLKPTKGQTVEHLAGITCLPGGVIRVILFELRAAGLAHCRDDRWYDGAERQLGARAGL
jgi:hypothetical protein